MYIQGFNSQYQGRWENVGNEIFYIWVVCMPFGPPIRVSKICQAVSISGKTLHVTSAPDTVYVREPVGVMDHQKAKSLGPAGGSVFHFRGHTRKNEKSNKMPRGETIRHIM